MKLIIWQEILELEALLLVTCSPTLSGSSNILVFPSHLVREIHASGVCLLKLESVYNLTKRLGNKNHQLQVNVCTLGKREQLLSFQPVPRHTEGAPAVCRSEGHQLLLLQLYSLDSHYFCSSLNYH